MARTVVMGLANNDVDPMPAVRQSVFYILLMSLLTFSALMYLTARQGALYRSRTHQRVPRADLDKHFADISPSITVLVPSYAEEPAVVRSTLLSAVLQEFPNLRIVLLIDDPPNPTGEHARQSLDGCRALPGEITQWLQEPAQRFRGPTVDRRGSADHDEIILVAQEYEWAGAWLRDEQRVYPIANTGDDFVADEVLGGPGVRLRSDRWGSAAGCR
jgi:cellulose synthase (UDP-forming)